MSGYKKLSSTLSNICNTTQLDDSTKCHYAFKNFWGEPWEVKTRSKISIRTNLHYESTTHLDIVPSFRFVQIRINCTQQIPMSFYLQHTLEFTTPQKKLLVTSIFSLFHNVFYCGLSRSFHILVSFSTCNCFQYRHR